MKRKLAELCAALVGRHNLGCEYTRNDLGPLLAAQCRNMDMERPGIRMSFNTIVVSVCADLIEGDDDSLFVEEAAGWIDTFLGLSINDALAQYETIRFYLADWFEKESAFGGDQFGY